MPLLFTAYSCRRGGNTCLRYCCIIRDISSNSTNSSVAHYVVRITPYIEQLSSHDDDNDADKRHTLQLLSDSVNIN